MRYTFKVLAVTLLVGMLLQGCAALLVGGAATGAATLYDRRTPGAVLDDQRIEVTAYDVKTKHPEILNGTDLSVVSYNGWVLITGTSSTAELSKRYEALISRIQGVRRTFNEVAVGADRELWDATQDTYITSKVKLALFKVDLEGFDPSRVKVVTSNRVVYLMGLVSPEEGKAAAEVIRHVRGVKRVVKLFEQI
jgi:osmotically-inducible protein OsmY